MKLIQSLLIKRRHFVLRKQLYGQFNANECNRFKVAEIQKISFAKIHNSNPPEQVKQKNLSLDGYDSSSKRKKVKNKKHVLTSKVVKDFLVDKECHKTAKMFEKQSKSEGKSKKAGNFNHETEVYDC